MAVADQYSHLVVVGSSAGGTEALSELVATIPEDFPAPVLIAQHLDPDRESHLEDILSRRSILPVVVAHSGCRKISVGLDFGRGEVRGRVEDDGRGFDPENGRAGVASGP